MDAIKVEKTEQKVDVDELFRAFKSEIEGGTGDAKKADAVSEDVKPSTSEEKPLPPPAEGTEEEEQKDPLLNEFYSEVRIGSRSNAHQGLN